MGGRELRLALATLASFTLVFVLEWLPEMLPLARYMLGMRSADFAVANRNTRLQPYQYTKASWQPSRREATLGDLGSATALRRALPFAVLAALRQHLAPDLLLYEQSRALAQRQAAAWLYAPLDAPARGATGVAVPIGVGAQRSRAGGGGPLWTVRQGAKARNND